MDHIPRQTNHGEYRFLEKIQALFKDIFALFKDIFIVVPGVSQ